MDENIYQGLGDPGRESEKMTLNGSVCTGICADAGTVNCPCPLAETGDCLVCSRLSGSDRCDCSWAGVCIYNEYIQNGEKITGRRRDICADIVRKIYYGDDLQVMVLRTDKGFAMRASQPGAFVFVNRKDRESFYNIPLSVMKADAEKGEIYLALKVISGKTKLIAEAEDQLMVRGVYRSGLAGCGAVSLCGRGCDRTHAPGSSDVPERWLIITKGVGFAPAVNILRCTDSRTHIDMAVDPEKTGTDIIRDYLEPEIEKYGERGRLRYISLADSPYMVEYDESLYSRMILLVSDYYIRRLTETMHIPAEKLVHSNNFSMCCGEGICGACCMTDSSGRTWKMCKSMTVPGSR